MEKYFGIKWTYISKCCNKPIITGIGCLKCSACLNIVKVKKLNEHN